MRFAALLVLITLAPAVLAEPVVLDDGTEIPIERFEADAAEVRLLWLPPEGGLAGRELEVARSTAGQGVSVWVADLHTAYFLPPGRSSLEQVPVEDVAALIAAASEGVSALVLVASSRSAATALAGARRWQLAHPDATTLRGAVLFYPNLQAGLPEPGQAPRYLPIVGATDLPLYIFQPLQSARRWHLAGLVERLEAGGSDIFRHPLTGVSDDFLNRSDATGAERRLAREISPLLTQAVELLGAYAGVPRRPPARLGEAADAGNGPAAGLRPHRGDPDPPPLELPGLDGRTVRLADFGGQVVLVNFWATWCPPCVHEIPSLGRLQQRLEPHGFTVLAVDVGESAEAVRAFLEKRPAHFPILLDSAGEAVDAWNVSAFPTNFLLDAEGRIRYSYYGALEWDAPEVVDVVEALLAERSGSTGAR